MEQTLNGAISLIQVAVSRGAYRPEELVGVGNIYKQIKQELESLAQEEANKEDKEEPKKAAKGKKPDA